MKSASDKYVFFVTGMAGLISSGLFLALPAFNGRFKGSLVAVGAAVILAIIFTYITWMVSKDLMRPQKVGQPMSSIGWKIAGVGLLSAIAIATIETALLRMI